MRKEKVVLYTICFLCSFSLYSNDLENRPLLFGNPSQAKADVSFNDNYLMEKVEYTLSYNNSTLCPNWVAWHLGVEDLGEAGRSNKFKADETLPDGWYKVTAQDYQYPAYGFDRGHVCPSADRTSNQTANQNTFLMTNMIPQSPDCNRIVWMHMENFERELVAAGNELYIFAGPAGKGGEGNRGIFEEILTMTKDGNECKIRVPQFCWKIILSIPAGESDFERVCTSASEVKIYAVCIPNKQGVAQKDGQKVDWENYGCSIDYIEEITGYNFLSELPDEVEELLEK